MATGEALVCRLKNISEIVGADQICQANLFGETVIVSKDYKEGQLGLLFDCESKLSDEYSKENNLFRHNTFNKDKNKVGYLDDNCRIRAIKLRGVKCSALFMLIESIDYITKPGGLNAYPKEGTQITEWNGHKICEKYMRPVRGNGGANNKQIKKVQQVLNFPENGDTDHLMRNLHRLEIDNLLTVTAKVHGTSCRAGMLPCTPRSKFGRWWQKTFKTKNTYRFCVGSRHVLKWVDGNKIDDKDSYYEDNVWKESAQKYFYEKLQPSEIVFYEIVGNLPSGASIMPSHSNDKLKKFMEKDEYKEFIKKYGNETRFTYGCNDKEYKIFVYRIAMVTEQGTLIDLSWSQLKRRCEELAVNYVPEITRIYLDNTNIDYYKNEDTWNKITEKEYSHFPMHIDEGIVCRIEGQTLKPVVLKSKKINFKILEGIIKDSQEHADIEDSN